MLPSPGSRVGRGVFDRSRPPRTKVRLAGNISFTHDVWTAVPWDTLVEDNAGAWNPNTPKIITPPHGFNSVKISLQINFTANANIGAFIAVCKNGTDAIGNAVRMDLCPAGNEMNRSLRSDHVDFVLGDFFYVMVLINTTLGVGGGLSGTGAGGPSTGEFRWFR